MVIDVMKAQATSFYLTTFPSLFLGGHAAPTVASPRVIRGYILIALADHLATKILMEQRV